MQKNYLSFNKTALIAAVGLLTATMAFAEKATPVDLAKKELRAVQTAEMPAKAASMVADAKADVAESTTESVVAAAVSLRPASTIAVVSAISQRTPAQAATAAGKAAALQPKGAATIARAAASTAPSQAAKIAYAVCKVAPEKYSLIAKVVAEAAPGSSKEIVAAVYEALPSLKPFVERASTDSQDSSVSGIMARTESLVQASAKTAKVTPETIVKSPTPAFLPPPTQGPPFNPPLAPPSEVNRTNVVEIPPGGGRNYSGP